MTTPHKDALRMIDERDAEIAKLQERLAWWEENHLSTDDAKCLHERCGDAESEAARLRKWKDAESRMLPLCSDHRDKQYGKDCLACTIEMLQTEVARLRAEFMCECKRYERQLDSRDAEVTRLRAVRDALNAQLTNTGIVPYLDRMRELAEQRDEAREMVRKLLRHESVPHQEWMEESDA